MPARSTIRRILHQSACAMAHWLGRGRARSPVFAEEPGQGSSAFERFRRSFFEDEGYWRYGLDKSTACSTKQTS